MRSPNWIQQADQAMQRAALRARAVAASTNTPIHIIKDGKIVAIMPGATPPPQPSRLPRHQDESSTRESRAK